MSEHVTIIRLLTEIRDLLAQMAELPEAPATDPDVSCEHPEDARLDLSTLGETHWLCQACGYEWRAGQAS